MSVKAHAEPYRLRAGALALVVHLAFFVLLYFGVSWQVEPPRGMVVDIWDHLPDKEKVSEKKAPSRPVEPPKPVKQLKPVKPVVPPKVEPKVSEKKISRETPKPIKAEVKPQPEKADAKAEQKVQLERERARAEQAELVARLRSKLQVQEKADPLKAVEPKKSEPLTKADIALAEKKKLLEKQMETPKPDSRKTPEKVSAQPDRKAEEERKAAAEQARKEEEKKAETERIKAEKAQAEKRARAEKLKADAEKKAEAERLEAEQEEAERLLAVKKAEAEKKAREEKFRAEQKIQEEKIKAEQRERLEKLRAELKEREEKLKAEQREREERIRAEQRAREERIRAEQRAMAEEAAANSKIVDEYKARIIAKIRRNIVMPPDIPYNAVAEFEVTLLPGGMVLNTQLMKPSGNAVYDLAVERAIKKSQPLPLPPDPALFNRFRELHLKVSPKE